MSCVLSGLSIYHVLVLKSYEYVPVDIQSQNIASRFRA